jgi:hypothetical protein
MAVNPDRLRKFLQPNQPGVTVSTAPGMRGTATLASLGASGAGSKRAQQVPPIQRGDLRTFQTTFRGGANLLAPALPEARRDLGRVVTAPTLPSRAPDVGEGGGKTLDDVWRKSLFAQAEGLDTVDRTKVMRPDADGNVAVLRMEPDRFVMGRVLRPKVHVETLPAVALADDGARLMGPKERRAIHDAEVNSRLGYLALRDAYKSRKKLANTCAINYPHGVLGCSESPYTTAGLESEIYGAKAREMVTEDMRAQRKGKGGGEARPPLVLGTGLDVGETDRPPRVHGRSHRVAPKDTLSLKS